MESKGIRPISKNSCLTGGQKMGEIIARGGIFSSKKIISGKVLIAFNNYKPNITDFTARDISREEVPDICSRTTMAIARARTKIEKLEDQGIKNMLLILLEDIEPRLLKMINEEKVCTARAAMALLEKFSAQKNSPDENMRNLYFQVHDLLVTILNEKRVGIADIREFLDRSDEPVVIVCKDVPEAEVAILEHPKVVAVLREEGGKRDHKQILLKNYNKLGVVGLNNISSLVNNGDSVIVNGIQRTVCARPSARKIEKTLLLKEHFGRIEQELASERTKEALTLDGMKITVNLNVEGLEEMQLLEDFLYSGVGLVRTEHILARNSDGYPRKLAPPVDEQKKIYGEIISRSQNVRFRTLDIDDDKILPYLDLTRIGLKEQGFKMFLNPENFQLQQLFKSQLTALLLAGGRKQVMFPNVFNLEDFSGAMRVVSKIFASFHSLNPVLKEEVVFGIMVEHLAIVRELVDLSLGKIAFSEREKLKFVSIGTNDLTRYTLGVSRVSHYTSDEYDELNPLVLENIRNTITACNKLGLEVSLCGDMGNDPLALIVLLGMGIKSLSLTPDFVDIGRKIIRSVDAVTCEKLVTALRGSLTAEQNRQTIKDYIDCQMENQKWPGLKIISNLIIT